MMIIQLQLNNNYLTKLQLIIKKLDSWQEICKEVKDNEEIYDNHRYETLLNVHTESNSFIKELMKEVGCIAKMIDEDLVIKSLTSLCSKANGTI